MFEPPRRHHRHLVQSKSDLNRVREFALSSGPTPSCRPELARGLYGRRCVRTRGTATVPIAGYGAGPLDLATSAQIHPGRTEHADVVEAWMLEEPDILDRDDRTSQ